MTHASPDFIDWVSDLYEKFPIGTKLHVQHDGFKGRVIGYYLTEQGKPGLVLQLTGTNVVHVYSTKWFEKVTG